MVRIIIALLFCFPAVAFAQTYQQLSERAIECIEKDSLPQAEELLLQALKLEPKNAKNALLFSNLGLVQSSAVWVSLIKRWSLILLH